MSTQLQAYLFRAPVIIPVCAYCHQPKSKVTADRQTLTAHRAGEENVICCTPDSESHCPDCDSMALEFSEYDNGIEAKTGYSDSGEIFACHDCGAMGDASDCAPAVQPWAELEAVAKGWEDRIEWLRRAPRPETGERLVA